MFLGVRALPGDPATALGAENRDPAVMAAIRHHYGLDQPVPVQYAKWLGLALQGDLGRDQRDLSVAQTIVAPPPDHARARVPLDHGRDPDRDPRGDHRGGEAAKACGLRRDERGARRVERAALLARADDDQLLRRPALTGFRRAVLRAVLRGPDREPPAHAHARDRPRDRPLRGADAADALVDADLARHRLHPDCTRKGPLREVGDHEARAAELADHDHDDRRAPDGRAHLRRRRDGVRSSRSRASGG